MKKVIIVHINTYFQKSVRSIRIVAGRVVTFALVSVLATPMLVAAMPQTPSNLQVSGDPTLPTLSWDTVPNEQTTGAEWNELTPNASFSARSYHATVVFDNKIWVLGGSTTAGSSNDVWYSSDGITWTQATANAAWSDRFAHSAVVFDNKMWVIGGGAIGETNDVWYSSDGITWTQATANAALFARQYMGVVVLNNKMWVIGGSGNNDVWYSSDGITWTQATANAAWSDRSGPAAAVFDNKMWVLGGSIYNDVWYSSDGATWTQATANAAWTARSDFTVATFEGKLWISGGYDGNAGSGIASDVWYSSDGITWTEATSAVPWGDKVAHSLTVFNNRLWAIAGAIGINWDNTNDVWSTPNHIISHYKICWDTVQGGCTNSTQTAASSYTLGSALTTGTWYFSVLAVNYEGEGSVLAATTTFAVMSSPSLPNAGRGYLIFILLSIAILSAGVYKYITRKKRYSLRV